MSARGDYLFSAYDLHDVLSRREQTMLEEIETIEGNSLLNSSADDLCDFFEQKYHLEVPRLNEDKISIQPREAQVDVSRDHSRAIFDRSRPFYITGTAVTFFIPFEGDPELFKCNASSFNVGPRGTISGNEVVLTYTLTDHDEKALRSAFESDLSRIRETLKRSDSTLSPFNASIWAKARDRIEARRQKLLKDQGLVAALGIPLRRRQDTPQTFVVPTVRRKATMPRPSGNKASFVPEPALEMQEYEHILSVISNMVVVMERSPSAFRGMSEEDLRQHFLVQLNGQYEGQATGETFNFEGKTDILIRAEGKNVFVAECKFWDGPESLKKALDQLLGYTTWRDTKTALLVFNRSKNFSSILGKIPEAVKSHENFKRQLPSMSVTGFRFVLHHRDDPNRELILTVLAFEVPA